LPGQGWNYKITPKKLFPGILALKKRMKNPDFFTHCACFPRSEMSLADRILERLHNSYSGFYGPQNTQNDAETETEIPFLFCVFLRVLRANNSSGSLGIYRYIICGNALGKKRGGSAERKWFAARSQNRDPQATSSLAPVLRTLSQ
jgi:hypothetical protein